MDTYDNSIGLYRASKTSRCVNGLRDPDHAPFRVHTIGLDIAYVVYKIWRLCLQPFRRYDWGPKSFKCVQWLDVSIFPGYKDMKGNAKFRKWDGLEYLYSL